MTILMRIAGTLLFWILAFCFAYILGAWLLLNAPGQFILTHDDLNQPVVAVDIFKALGNEKVQQSWQEVGSAPILGKPLQTIQATSRTFFEPIKATGKYATQDFWSLTKTAITAYLIGATATGYLDDHAEKIGDIFESDDDDSNNFGVVASGPNSEIEIKDAKQQPLSATAEDGGKILIDFQTEGTE